MSFSPPHSRAIVFPALTFWRNRLVLALLGVGCLTSIIWTDQTPVQAQESPQPLRRDAAATATQPTIWVNPQTGNDAKADGSEQAPFRTLTRAVEQAQPNTLIQLAPGNYSTDTGEVFPIVVRSNITIQGNPDELGQGVVIRGGGSYTSASQDRQNVALVLSRQSTLAGVTVTNPTVRGHGIWVEAGNPTLRDNTFLSSTQSGLVVASSSTPDIQNNLFLLNRVSGLTVTDSARPTVAENVFQRTGSGLVISKDAAPRIVSNRISQNRDGVVIQDSARPILRSNTVEDSARDGLVVIAQAQPNLGTPQDPGNNVFSHNRQHDIDALATRQVLPAFGNQFADNRLSGNVDLTGNAPLVGVTTVASAASQIPVSPASAPAPRPAPARSATAVSAQSSPTPPGQSQAQSLISTAPSAASRPAPTLISSLPPSSQMAQTPTAYSAAGRNPTQVIAAASSRSPRPDANRANSVSQQSAASAAVEINVPPPETTGTRSAAALRSAARPAVSPASTAQPRAAVQIPVPTPESSAAVQIPVPAPESPVPTLAMATAVPQMPSVTVAAAPSLPRQTASVAAPQLGGSPITIPVPPPERSQVSRPASASTPASTTVAAANSGTQILRVPSAEIPLGNTGDLSRISVANSVSPAVLAANRASLQYRVIVQAEDVETQERVKSVIPGAFATSVDGQMVVQVGAFSDRDNAAEVVEQLSQNGLQGIIQPME